MKNKLRIYKFIDYYIGYIICVILIPFSLFRKRIENREPKNILIIRLWAMGETILTFPALHSLKHKYKNIKVTALITYRLNELISMNPDIDSVIVLSNTPLGIIRILNEIRRSKYDYVFDLEPFMRISAIISLFSSRNRVGFNTPNIRKYFYNIREKYNNNEHAAMNFYNLFKIINIESNGFDFPELLINNKDLSNVEYELKIKNSKTYIIGIHPGAGEGASYRMWSTEKFADLINLIMKNKLNIKILLIGSNREKEKINEIMKICNNSNIRIALTTTVNQLAAYIKYLNIYIGNDTGPLHLSAALGIKTIGLFGPETPIKYRPYGKESIAIYKNNVCKYSPCIVGYLNKIPKKCINKFNYQICLKSITIEEVYSVIKEYLNI